MCTKVEEELTNFIFEQSPLRRVPEVILLGVQHLSYTTARMFSTLVSQGFPPENIYLLGKCYSSNPVAIQLLTELGINVAKTSMDFDSHQDYDTFFSKNVRNFFSPLITQASQKLIVLDDGGALLQMVAEFTKNNAVKVVAIEQTSSGFHRAKDICHVAPIINVARSVPKLAKESLFIARMVVNNAKRVIQSFKATSFPKILIIGAGVIGTGIYQMLSKEYKVDLWDIVLERGTILQPNLDSRLGDYDVIIGCTGNCSIPHTKHCFLKTRSILISASSSDREFDSVFLRKQFSRYDSCHRSLQTAEGIILINSGFPINFDANFLDSSEFQLTRSLLITAIGQALELLDNNVPFPEGFIPLKNTDALEMMYAKMFPSDPMSQERSRYEMRFPASNAKEAV